MDIKKKRDKQTWRGQNRKSARCTLARKRKKWLGYTKRRRIKHFVALPMNIRKELNILCAYILERDRYARMKLTGSWQKGTWTTDKQDREFRKHRLELINSLGNSPLHIVLESSVRFTQAELQQLIGTSLKLWLLPCDQVNGITVCPTNWTHKTFILKKASVKPA